MKKTIVILTLLTTSSYTLACELTDDYKIQRTKFVQVMKRPYEECITSVGNYHFYLELTKCERLKLGENIGGGCYHIAENNNTKTERPTDQHCEILHVTTSEIKTAWETHIKKSDLQKCKDEEQKTN